MSLVTIRIIVSLCLFLRDPPMWTKVRIMIHQPMTKTTESGRNGNNRRAPDITWFLTSLTLVEISMIVYPLIDFVFADYSWECYAILTSPNKPSSKQIWFNFISNVMNQSRDSFSPPYLMKIVACFVALLLLLSHSNMLIMISNGIEMV